jgi:hypothetical protein
VTCHASLTQLSTFPVTNINISTSLAAMQPQRWSLMHRSSGLLPQQHISNSIQNYGISANPLLHHRLHHNYGDDFAGSEDDIGWCMRVNSLWGYIYSLQTPLHHHRNASAVVLEHLQVILLLAKYFHQVLCNLIGETVEARPQSIPRALSIPVCRPRIKLTTHREFVSPFTVVLRHN